MKIFNNQRFSENHGSQNFRKNRNDFSEILKPPQGFRNTFAERCSELPGVQKNRPRLFWNPRIVSCIVLLKGGPDTLCFKGPFNKTIQKCSGSSFGIVLLKGGPNTLCFKGPFNKTITKCSGSILLSFYWREVSKPYVSSGPSIKQ